MKKIIFYLLIPAFLLITISNLNAQCPQCGGGSYTSTLAITIDNRTNCQMYYAVEASQNDCTGCGGVYGWVDANTPINRIICNCGLPDTSCDIITWALADYFGHACEITSAEGFNTTSCTGTDIHGNGSGCCNDDWDVSISGNTVTIY